MAKRARCSSTRRFARLISVSEDAVKSSDATRLTRVMAAVKRVLAERRLVAAWGVTLRGAGVIAAVLVALLVFLHARADDDDTQRYTGVLAQLAAVKLVDARWDVAVLRSRSDPGASTERVVQPRDVTRIQRALDLAYANARSNAMRVSIEALKKSYMEKADLVTRFQQASADARQALDAAMRADVAVSTLVRTAWREFPDRERLVAAENLVARVLAEAQQYHHAPTSASRAALEGVAVDLPRAHSLPRAVQAALARLESDIDQVLLLKPLEQTLGERLTVLNTGTRADDLAETYQRHLTDALDERSRYRTALLVYSVLLLIVAGFAARRAYLRFSALEASHAAQVHELAEVREQLRVAEPASIVDLDDIAGAQNVRFIRRP
jgi:adenylate kinase family enzyme